jgi:hypothetical protein
VTSGLDGEDSGDLWACPILLCCGFTTREERWELPVLSSRVS